MEIDDFLKLGNTELESYIDKLGGVLSLDKVLCVGVGLNYKGSFRSYTKMCKEALRITGICYGKSLIKKKNHFNISHIDIWKPLFSVKPKLGIMFYSGSIAVIQISFWLEDGPTKLADISVSPGIAINNLEELWSA